MKNNEALAVLNSKIVAGMVDMDAMDFQCEIEGQIRTLSSKDTGFENTVFELGVSKLAKAYLKAKEKE